MVEDLENQLEELIALIEETIARVRRNELVDISFMDKDVAELCRKILNAPDNKTGSIEPKMAEMINRLDELAAELQHYKERAGGK